MSRALQRSEFRGYNPPGGAGGATISVNTLIKRLEESPALVSRRSGPAKPAVIRLHKARDRGDIPLIVAYNERRRHIPRSVKRVICNSEATAEHVREIHPWVDVFVLHPMVDDYSYPEWGDLRDGIGHVIERRNYMKGGDVITALEARLPDKHFVFSGGLPNSLMREFYARLAVLLVPSRVEPYGRPVVEAASAGVPVLAADLPGLRETECAAAYLPVDDLDAWVEAIEEFGSGDQDLRNAARARYEANRERQDRELESFIQTFLGIVS